ncbi:hypothetical protein BU15DRAFT_68884, partial [Melanogaster broomeanus]
RQIKLRAWSKGLPEVDKYPVMVDIATAFNIPYYVSHILKDEHANKESGQLGCDGLPLQAVALWIKAPSLATAGPEDHTGVTTLSRFLQTDNCQQLSFKDFDLEVVKQAT